MTSPPSHRSRAGVNTTNNRTTLLSGLSLSTRSDKPDVVGPGYDGLSMCLKIWISPKNSRH